MATLIQREHAYVGPDGVVYFSVESFPRYGQLSGNTLEALRVGAGGRIDIDNQSCKRHPADFMLWKPDPKHIMKWDSPWGAGYPGWHIECSTMSMHAWISSTGSDAAESYGVLLALDQVLGVWELAQEDYERHGQENEIAINLCALIDEARRARDFSTADAHRQRLIQLGYEVRSTSDGTQAKKKLA